MSVGYNKTHHLGRDRISVDFSFVTNATAQPSTSNFRGNGVASVTRTAAGTFTVTFDRKYGQLDTVVVDSRKSGVYTRTARAGAYSASNKTLVVYTVTASTGALVDATDDTVSVKVVFRNATYEGHI